jgi:hypothetical protein
MSLGDDASLSHEPRRYTMSRTTKAMRTSLSLLAVAGALGFGTAAAWAEPDTIAKGQVCEEAGDRWACMSCCYDAGAAAYAWGSHYGCVCIFRE